MSLAFGFALPHWQAISGGFSPQSLFTGGVQGVLFDISDLSTLFTTSAGTTPAAMPGLGSAVSVGLMLDKSQGLVLGSETVTNGGPFTATTGWTGGGGGTLSVSSQNLRITNSISDGGAATFSAATPVIGKHYKVQFTIVSRTAASASRIIFGGNVISDLGPGTYTYYLFATTTGAFALSNGATGVIGQFADYNNISVRELLGNHAISFNDTTARPELRARVNLLTYSEEFDNAYWTKGSASISANTNATTDPLGGNNADKLIEAANNAAHFVERNMGGLTGTFTVSIYAKAAERTWLHVQLYPLVDGRAWFDLANGVLGTVDPTVTATITPAGNGWYKCTVSRNTGNTTFVNFYTSTGNNVSSYLGDGTSGIYIWGADLRPANIGANVPAYQRIADANTYDTSGFPLYLRFDGIDDSMYTPANLNLSGTDKVAVFAGVRKLSDAAFGMVAETSPVVDTTNGAMAIGASIGGAQRWVSALRGTSLAYYEPATYAAPVTNVLAALFDIAGAGISNEIVPRINGVVEQDNPFGASAGTGNFGTYPLFIGARNNAGTWLNGQIYSLIIAGSAVSAGNITATEQWVAGKTGIQI